MHCTMWLLQMSTPVAYNMKYHFPAKTYLRATKSSSAWESVSRSLPLKIGLGECYKTPLIKVNVCSGNGLVSIISQQAITWDNDDQDLWRNMVSLGQMI